MKTKFFLFVFFCISLLGLCSACGDTPQEPLNIAVVATVANNNPLLEPALIEELENISCTAGSYYTLILADGAPFVLAADEIADLSGKGYTSAMLRRLSDTVQAGFEQAFVQAAPVTPEVDLAAAIQLATRSLKEKQVEKKLLVLYGSGISTTGTINMVESPISTTDVATSVSELAAFLDIDLTGVSVVLYGIGDVTGTQPTLSPPEVKKLQSFWETLFLQMNAEQVTFRSTIPPEGSYDFAPTVSCMNTEGVHSQLVVNDMDHADKVLSSGGIASIDIRFAADSIDFLAEAEAQSQLADVAAFLLENPDKKLLVCGTTTKDGDADSCRSFSLRRAVMVAELLRKNAAADQVSAIGVGFTSPFYQDEQTGGWNENIARSNRSVKFLVSGSKAAEQLLSNCTYLTEDGK